MTATSGDDRKRLLQKLQSELKNSLGAAQTSHDGFRSLTWRVLLSEHVVDVDSLIKSITISRSTYQRIKKQRILTGYPSESSDAAIDNPLSQSSQGMHELLAPLLFTVHCDKQKLENFGDFSYHRLYSLIVEPDRVEYDAYSLFSLLMEGVKHWFSGKEQESKLLLEINPKLFNRMENSATNDLVKKLSELHDNRLKRLDTELYIHLERNEIAPQVYGIRWLRLLFGREFAFEDILPLWDSIFSNVEFLETESDSHIKFPFVDCIFLAMLSTIREKLLSSDYTGCLQLLMKYPPMIDIRYVIRLASHIQNPTKHRKPEMPLYMVLSKSVDHSSELTQAVHRVNHRHSVDQSKIKIILQNSDKIRSSILSSSSFKNAKKSTDVEVGLDASTVKVKTKELRPIQFSSHSKSVQEHSHSIDNVPDLSKPPCLSQTSLLACIEQMSNSLAILQNSLQEKNMPLDDDAFVAVAELKQVRDTLKMAISSNHSEVSCTTAPHNVINSGNTSFALDALSLEEAEEVTDQSVLVKSVLHAPFSTGNHI
ncbi:TBC1 domain family member 5 homolog A-like isoform X2 [Artemia franciscana]|uniref:TBC1 domain family member 5 homolog A-like isoform X2 n=1 Tax=Artemia franciscana TaxID=6661 RepID=UPI0032DA18EF